MSAARPDTTASRKHVHSHDNVTKGDSASGAVDRRAFLNSALVTAVFGATAAITAPRLSWASIRSWGSKGSSVSDSVWTNAGPWLGALTDSGAAVKVSAFHDIKSARLVVAQDERLERAVATFPAASVWEDGQRRYKHQIIGFQATDLEPDREYFYAVELDGKMGEAPAGRFRTAPPTGSRSSFRFALASCARPRWTGGVRPEAYRAIANDRDLLFFCHLGDLHYTDNRDEEIGSRLEDYDDALKREGPRELFRTLPVAYAWDDHDFLGNGSGGADPKRRSAAGYARDAYGIYTPHYELARPQDGIYQVFEIGRVLFLLTDTRSRRSPSSGSPTGRSMLGVMQKSWLMSQLLCGKSMDLIVWVNSIPWIGEPRDDEDFWAGYSDERRELAQFIVDNGIRNICMIGGDAHMVAIDDGSHSGYAGGGRGSFPVFQAAALESGGSVKGGPYSHGNDAGGPGKGIAGRRQFGLFEVLYDSATAPPRVRWTAKRARKETAETTSLLHYEFAAERTFDRF